MEFSSKGLGDLRFRFLARRIHGAELGWPHRIGRAAPSQVARRPARGCLGHLPPQGSRTVGKAGGDRQASARAVRRGADPRAGRVGHGRFRDHIDLEDDLLLPALRSIDAWGRVRAEQLEHHHAEQRDQLRTLESLGAAESPEVLARLLYDLIESLRDDMTYEDQVVLSSVVLRDDVVVADTEAG
jgi:hypothetical protein